jgi:hypothetical protein
VLLSYIGTRTHLPLGCPGPSPCRAGWEYCLSPNPRRSPSSICQDLICDKDTLRGCFERTIDLHVTTGIAIKPARSRPMPLRFGARPARQVRGCRRCN